MPPNKAFSHDLETQPEILYNRMRSKKNLLKKKWKQFSGPRKWKQCTVIGWAKKKKEQRINNNIFNYC